MRMHLSRARKIVAAVTALLSVALLAGCSEEKPNDRTITLTLIRYAETEGNSSGGVIDTTPPGPSLTPVGVQQASALANRLKAEKYDGIYASQLVRTQQTAAPMSKTMNEPVNVLPGLDEVGAGWYDGGPTDRADATFMVAPKAWVEGNRNFAIPGGATGNEFNGKFTGAVQRIYESGDNKPVAFSSGTSIMVWTLMNVSNPKTSLLTDHPLPNTGRIVITGNPVIGWKLVDWDGVTGF